MDNFQIPRERILRSRDLTFHRDLLRATQNRGVDVVLNSVSIPDLFSLLWKSTLLMSALALRWAASCELAMRSRVWMYGRDWKAGSHR
jgi:hypothetical protein